MKRFFVFFVFTIIYSGLTAQLETAQWICGYQVGRVSQAVDTGANKEYGANIIDFRKSPVGVIRKFRTLSMNECNVSMCDSMSNLLFFSNGSKIFNRYDSLIEGADSFSPSKIWNIGWNSRDLDYFGYTVYSIYLTKQAMIAIPRPHYPNQFYIINFYMNTDSFLLGYGYRFTSLHYSILDMNANNGRGKIILKEKKIWTGNLSSSVTACKHGNGKDWWVAAQDYRGNRVYTFLANKDSVSFSNTSSYTVPDFYVGSTFSTNGLLYAASAIDSGVNLFRFNRCNGKLTFFKYLNRPKIDSVAQIPSVAFSPNNRFLYYATGWRLYQYDMLADNDSMDRTMISYYPSSDPYIDSFLSFFQIQQAIDGKLYISAVSKFLSVIDNPNEKGHACNLRQGGLRLLTWNSGIPHFPNYALGADTCYTNSLVESTKTEFAIYPNPANDKLVIKFSSPLIRNAQLYITDIIGKEILNQSISTHNGLYELSTQKWANGSYIVQIYEGKKKVSTHKLIVNH